MAVVEKERHFDVLIVGAGLSGVGAAWHLSSTHPRKTYAILEARSAIGGTWDLFRYPGIRSDSDMYTLGYSFRPWRDAKAIADGPAIRSYVADTAKDAGIDRHIRFGRRVVSADWSTEHALWTVTTSLPEGGAETYTCGFLMMCSGYYRYDAGHTPDFPGSSDFRGRIIHPQFWPENLDYAGKNVVVIGSGATAVTIVPEMARTAAHVTMLQRSPTYVVSRPSSDPIANALRKLLPTRLAYSLARWKNVLMGMYMFRASRRQPEKVKSMLINLVRKELGEGYDVETHFTPRYNPWTQRLCLVPDGDLFASIREGRASVVTSEIESFTPEGVRLKTGQTLPADIIVTATGLELLFLGGMQVSLDGRPVDMTKTLTYKGMMYEGVPNLASVFGYTNASWTLKADLTCEHVCRLLRRMDQTGLRQVTPRNREAGMGEEPWLDFSSGYVQRSLERFPKQGEKRPWKLHQNYILDIMTLRHGAIEDPALEFSNPEASALRLAG